MVSATFYRIFLIVHSCPGRRDSSIQSSIQRSLRDRAASDPVQVQPLHFGRERVQCDATGRNKPQISGHPPDDPGVHGGVQGQLRRGDGLRIRLQDQ